MLQPSTTQVPLNEIPANGFFFHGEQAYVKVIIDDSSIDPNLCIIMPLYLWEPEPRELPKASDRFYVPGTEHQRAYILEQQSTPLPHCETIGINTIVRLAEYQEAA